MDKRLCLSILLSLLLGPVFAIHQAAAQGSSTTTAPCPPIDQQDGQDGRGDGVATAAASADEAALAGADQSGWPADDEDEEEPEVKLIARQNGSRPPFKDFFFYDDGGSIELYFQNETSGVTPGSCGGGSEEGAIAVSFEIDGPDLRFFGPYPSEFWLAPGDEKTIELRLLDLLEFVVYMQADRLYGARVRITAVDDSGKTHLDETFDILRFLSVVNARQGATRIAAFLKTLADGGGGFVRKKRLDHYLASGVETTLVPAGAASTVFDVGSGLRGSGKHDLSFDPTAVGEKEAPVDIYVDSEQVGGATLTLRGTAVEPTEIGVGRTEFEALLLQYLRDEIFLDNLSQSNYRGSIDEIMRRASKPFKRTFAGHTEIEAPSLGSNATSRERDDQVLAMALFRGLQQEAVQEAGAALLEAVQRDFDAANRGIAEAFVVVGDGGDVSTGWLPQLFLGTSEVLGRADRDAATAELKRVLPDEKLPLVARLYLLAELINRQRQNGAEFGLLRQPGYGRTPDGALPNPPSFADFVSNTVSHELAHTFGLPDSYYEDPAGRSSPRWPYDIMRNGREPDPDLTFGTQHTLLLRASMGIAPDDPLELVPGFQVYRRNINLRQSYTGVRHLAGEEDWVPLLGLLEASEYLWNGESRSLGSVAVDGSGGERAVLALAVSNVGMRPLSVSAVELEGDTPGFTISEPPIGRALEPGGTVALEVGFDPTQVGEVKANLRIRSNDAVEESFILALEGEGLPPGGRLAVALAEDPAWERPTNNLGTARVGSGLVSRPGHLELTNTGGGPLTITRIEPGPEGDGQFGVAGIPLGLGAGSPLRLEPGEKRLVGLIFQAGKPGLHSGTVRIHSDDPENRVSIVPLVATALPISGSGVAYGDDFVAIELLDETGGRVLRTQSDRKGFFRLDLPAETDFHMVIFDPESGLVAHDYDRTAPAGQPTWLSRPTFGGSTAPDSDGDFLPDDVELALGTDPAESDSDGDGIADSDELRRGLLPRPRQRPTSAPQPASTVPSEALGLLDREIQSLAERLGIELQQSSTQSRGTQRTVVYKIVGDQPSGSDLLKALREWVEESGGEVTSTFVSGPSGLLQAKGVTLHDRKLAMVQFVLGGGKLAMNVGF